MGARTPEQREAFAQYWNKKVTAVNPNSTRLPDARNPASLPFIHICNTDEQVAIFMNRFQMHARCAPGKCLRKNKATNVVECRFFFPRELQERALVTKSINKKSWMFGVERNVERLAQCSPVMALGWLANTDLQPAVTYKGLILYVAKSRFCHMLVIRRPIASLAARLLNKLIGERDWSAQEISHILLKIPQQKSTSQCMVLDCRPDQAQDRHIQFDDGEAGGNMVVKEGLSAYKRYKLRIEHARGGERLRDVTLIDWLQHYDASKFQRLSKGKPRTVTFFPHYKSNPTDDEYEDYCRVEMMLSHPFEKVEDVLEVDGFQAETYQEAYELCCDSHNHADDLYDELDVDDDDTEFDADEEFQDVNPSRPTPPAPLADFETYGLAHPGNDLTRVEDGDNLGERDSDRQYDWRHHVGKYNIDPWFWDVTKRAFPAEQLLPSLNSVDLLNREQRTVYSLIVDHYCDFLAGRNPPQLRVNLDGVAGTGKTYVLLQASKRLEDMAAIAGVRDPVLRAAPTGIAAHNFHGRTLHSLFKIPVKTLPQGFSQKLSRSNLCSLQALFKHCKYLIIDEKSMIGIKFLGLLDHRLREIFPARQDEMYAGINIFVCGDFHQLPPIAATVMYSNLPNARNAEFLAGQQAYRALDTTARLTQLMRQDGDDGETLQFRRALEELRVYQNPSKDALRLYFRREGVRVHNHQRLRDCEQPILRIKSTHTGRGAEGANDDEADGLDPQLCMCLGARVMLTENIWVENGLVNGSMGTVRDVVWNEGQDPTKDMPTAIMVEVDDYDSPKFTSTNYIPIFPVTRRFEYKKSDCSRTNFPLRPAYAITVHKAQGLTLKQVVLNLERKDHVPGLSYVAISRVKRLSSIMFETPFDLSRFTTKVSSNMKDRARDWDMRTLQCL
ncbi:ATP-dependent DNA helicase PIF1, partial [Metarhizium hybridum]